MQDIRRILAGREPGILIDQKYTEHAVLLPLILRDNKPYLLFEMRSEVLNVQPGEICFPGGRIEKSDINPQAAAVREACEELGINKNSIEILGSLDILLTPHLLKIHPYVGIIADGTPLKPDASEVENTFTVPLEFFMDNKPSFSQVVVSLQPNDSFPYENIPNGREYKWRKGTYPVYFYEYKGLIIWGITARILHHFIDVLTNPAPDGKPPYHRAVPGRSAAGR